MKNIAKRSLSMLMALVLIVSLFSGVTLPVSAASYTYNWGERGETATSLSSAAMSFYARNNTSYEQLSSYTGSANLSSVPSSALYKQLQTLMKNNHSKQTNYKETRDMYQYTDCQNGGGKISSFYSGKEIGPAWDGGSTWNREHTWPNSKGLGGNDENDIMMLRPTATSENGGRGNTAYGISGGYYDPNRESGYTLNLHGDVARIFLYIYVRWGNVNGNGEYTTWGSRGVMESREVLLAWMEEDPVDTWELGRNDVVQEITGTRNVFVDYPELAFLMFGEEIPSDMTTPSGKAIAGTHKITVSSNDTAMGTVSLSGRNIQAYPAAGHKVVGYEVVSGTATVTQNGNTFEVKASSDCEIRIIFASKPVVELTYLDNGIVMSSGQVYGGDPATLSAYTGTAPAGYSFLGWVEAPVNITTAAPTHYKAGASYTVNGATKLHALFSCTVTGTNGSSTFYTTSPCTHANAAQREGKAATCDTAGYNAGVYCSDCERFISGGETIDALGHSYDSVVTEPTVTEPGYTTHTCSRCGDVYTSDPVPALGETYTVTFSVPVDAAPIEDMGCNTKGIILPESSALEGYTFLGWTSASLEDTTDAPVYYEAGEKYVTSANTTLYALYSYVVGGSVEGGYVLVTDASQLKSGTQVIIASASGNLALSTKQNNNNRGQAVITKSGEKITFDASAGVAVLTLCDGAVAGTYAFYCPINGGYLCAASSSSNYLRTKAALDANSSFLITVNASGVATATAQGNYTRNQLKYNSSSSIFGCYSSGQNDIALYVEAPAGTAHYTTNIVHRHSGTYHAAVAATCQSAGNVAYWSCGCGMAFSDSGCTQVLSSIAVPKLDHSFTVQAADAKYLKAEANCQSGAVYYLSCASCGTSSASDEAVFVYGSTNPYNHPGEGIFTGETPATCTTAGNTGNTVCAECGEVMKYGTEISATGHADAAAVAETASTCSTYGVKFHYHCDACGGDYLERSIGAVAQTAEDLQLPLDPNNHEGETEIKNASDATCEADGYTGDVHCIACGAMLEEGKTVTGGHTVENGICTRCENYGTCGDNLIWTYENGTLTVSGEGEMYDYSTETNPENAPWAYHLEKVNTIVIEEGVTSIGDAAFTRLTEVTKVSLPDTLTTIGGDAFINCVALEEIVIPAKVTYIGDAAFTFCYALTEITFEGNAPVIGREAFGLVTANVHYTPDATWTADMKQNYGGTLTWDSYVTGVAMVNGVDYETLAEALAAATSGDTVQLLQDVAETEVSVTEGVTLDLNGHTLTADYVFAVNGSHIVDSSEGNTGRLKVAADCIAVSKTNAQLPVGTGEGYIFIDLQNFQEMYTGNEADQKQYIFSPTFESVAHRYLALGKESSGVRIAIRMTWKSGSSTASQNFVFNDRTVKAVVESFNGSWYAQAFYVTVTNAEAADFTIQVSLVSDTGMELACN